MEICHLHVCHANFDWIDCTTYFTVEVCIMLFSLTTVSTSNPKLPTEGWALVWNRVETKEPSLFVSRHCFHRALRQRLQIACHASLAHLTPRLRGKLPSGNTRNPMCDMIFRHRAIRRIVGLVFRGLYYYTCVVFPLGYQGPPDLSDLIRDILG